MSSRRGSSVIHAIGGAFGSVISITCLFPLETARTRLQVTKSKDKETFIRLIHSIYQNEGGFRALYRGWLSTVISLFLTNFVYFYVFNASRKIIPTTVHGDFLCGIIAGIFAVLITNPFWVINTRLKLQGVNLSSDNSQNLESSDEPHQGKEKKGRKYRGSFHCAYCIWKEEHISVFWAGTQSSLLLVANPAIQFTCYEAIKKFTFSTPDTQINILNLSPSVVHFLNGAISKFAATLMTYPLQVLQTRTRAGCQSEKIEGKNLIRQMIFIAKNDGIPGLFKGFNSKITQTCLNAAIMFFIYEKVLATLVYIFKLE